MKGQFHRSSVDYNIAIDNRFTSASHQLIDALHDDRSDQTTLYFSVLNRFAARPQMPKIGAFMQAVNQEELSFFDKLEAKYTFGAILSEMNAAGRSGYRFRRPEYSMIYALVFDHKNLSSFNFDIDQVQITDRLSCEQVDDDAIPNPVVKSKIGWWKETFGDICHKNIAGTLNKATHFLTRQLFDYSVDKEISCIAMAVRCAGKGLYNSIYFNTLDVLSGKMPRHMDDFTYHVPATCSVDRPHNINLAVLTGHIAKIPMFPSEFISAVARGLNQGYLKKGNNFV